LPTELAIERVIPEQQAAQFLSLSYAQLRLMRSERTGPRYLRITAARIGYRIKDLIAWCDEQAEGHSRTLEPAP
jgi:hypothetical protein